MYFISVWLHILAAAVWVGGLIYTAAVVVPFAISHQGEERQRILRGLGRRFRWIAWGSMVVSIVTGIGNLLLRLTPISLSQIFNGDVFDPECGRPTALLPWTNVLLVMIGLMAFHDSQCRAANATKVHRCGAGNRAAREPPALGHACSVLGLVRILPWARMKEEWKGEGKRVRVEEEERKGRRAKGRGAKGGEVKRPKSTPAAVL